MKIMRIIAGIAILCVFLAGVVLYLGSTMSATDSAKLSAKKIIASKMKDPSSAVFNDEFTVLNPPSSDGLTILAACGSVSGKNSFGAYVGSVHYVVRFSLSDKDELSVIDATLDDMGSAAAEHGVSPFDKVYWVPFCVDNRRS